MLRNIPLTFLSIILLVFISNAKAQTLYGTTGLITVPTADIPRDKQILTGLNWIDKKYTQGSDKDNHNYLIGYVVVGYLPFLEIDARLTRWTTTKPVRRLGLGGRTVNFRLRLFTEGEYFPSVLVGVHDPLGDARYFNAAYLVLSKNMNFLNIPASASLGYSVDWINADYYDFLGGFGGISISPKSYITVMCEYDSKKINSGIRISLFKKLDFLLTLLNMDTFSGGISYNFKL
ncbi:hypothetical protein GF312_09095 [Candidatus Poribacteria bacterium]|nr:hypothetical protein [Candidatus Poribacteria bacterium]